MKGYGLRADTPPPKERKGILGNCEYFFLAKSQKLWIIAY